MSAWRAFPFSNDASIDLNVVAANGAQTADEYLALVRHVSRGIPDVMVSGINPATFEERQTTLPIRHARLNLEVLDLPSHFRRSDEWLNAVVSHFKWLRDSLEYWSEMRERGFEICKPGAIQSLPSAEDGKAWRRLCFGETTAMLLNATIGARHTKRMASASLSAPPVKRAATLVSSTLQVWHAPGAIAIGGDSGMGLHALWQDGDGNDDELEGRAEGEADSMGDDELYAAYADDEGEDEAVEVEVDVGQVTGDSHPHIQALPEDVDKHAGQSPTLAFLVCLDQPQVHKLLARFIRDFSALLDTFEARQPVPTKEGEIANAAVGASSRPTAILGSTTTGTLVIISRSAIVKGTLSAAAASGRACGAGSGCGTGAASNGYPLALPSLACTWLYCLLGRLHTPLLAESAALVRELLLLALRQRDMLALCHVQAHRRAISSQTDDSTSRRREGSEEEGTSSAVAAYDGHASASVYLAPPHEQTVEGVDASESVTNAPWSEDAAEYEAALEAFQGDGDVEKDEEENIDYDEEAAGETVPQDANVTASAPTALSLHEPLTISAIDAEEHGEEGQGTAVNAEHISGRSMHVDDVSFCRAVAGVHALIAVTDRYFGQRLPGE